MSYYNYMFVPCTDTLEQVDEATHMLFDENCDGFDNMLKLLNLTDNFIQVHDNIRFVVFKEVHGGNDVIRPSDLNWQWHERKTFYGDPDCFIKVSEMQNQIDWSNTSVDSNDLEKSLEVYQKHLTEHPENLVIFPL